MRSIRTKITLLSVIGVSVAIGIATCVGAITIADFGHESAEQALALLCEKGQQNLESYFKSVERSVNTVCGIFEQDLKSVATEAELSDHVENSKVVFAEAVNYTKGVSTYYYRIDPEVSATEKGYWFTNLDDKGFKPEKPTDIVPGTCQWFYETKEKGTVWLKPYMTDSLEDVYVLSYNKSVHKGEDFVGVVGIEISYLMLGDIVSEIKMLETGYAFVVDQETGQLIYHPTEELYGIDDSKRPVMPEEFYKGMAAGEHHISYTYKGIQKHSYLLPLSNGMDIVVAVPLSEVNATWVRLINRMLIVGASIIAAAIVASIILSTRITKPLKNLTKAAEEINKGSYAIDLTYKGKDEIGVLTSAMNNLVHNLGEYITELNSLAYADALTKMKNKSSFDLAMEDLQKQIDAGQKIEFAIVYLDCDNLKEINDSYGHDKGDVYLRNACQLMCRVFEHSDVYRIGGDEFAIILQGEDYLARRKLEQSFAARRKEIRSFAKEPWERIEVSIGVAEYDPKIDRSVHDVAVHADHLMYSNKRSRKSSK